MKTIHVENISYNLPDNVHAYTLPVELEINAEDDKFNKYTDIAKLIKEHVGYDVKHYTFTENTVINTNS